MNNRFLRDIGWHIEQLEKGTKDTELRATKEEWLKRADDMVEKLSNRPDAVISIGRRWSEFDD